MLWLKKVSNMLVYIFNQPSFKRRKVRVYNAETAECIYSAKNAYEVHRWLNKSFATNRRVFQDWTGRFGFCATIPDLLPFNVPTSLGMWVINQAPSTYL